MKRRIFLTLIPALAACFALAGAERLVHQDAAHRVRKGEGQLVRLRVA